MSAGHKRVKGVPELQDEVKKRVNMTLTPTATEGLDALASERRLSRSELIEQIGRGQILIVDVASSPSGEDEVFSLLSSIQFRPFEMSHQLPSVAGAFVVMDRKNRLLAGYTANLYDEFQGQFLLKRLDDFFKSFTGEKEYKNVLKTSKLFWIECSDFRLLPKLKGLIVEMVQKILTEDSLRYWIKEM